MARCRGLLALFLWYVFAYASARSVDPRSSLTSLHLRDDSSTLIDSSTDDKLLSRGAKPQEDELRAKEDKCKKASDNANKLLAKRVQMDKAVQELEKAMNEADMNAAELHPLRGSKGQTKAAREAPKKYYAKQSEREKLRKQARKEINKYQRCMDDAEEFAGEQGLRMRYTRLVAGELVES